MEKDILKQVQKILIAGDREKLDEILSGVSEEEQREVLTSILVSSSNILEDSKFNRVKTRPLLFYLINDAEYRGREENKKVLITYADQRKLGKINNKYGSEVGDKAIEAFVDSLHKGLAGIKKSNYDIVRMGGDEFCIITVGEDSVKQFLDEAKTYANTTRILANGKMIDEKVDFAYGTAELDYSGGKNLRRIIDDAKSKAYYSSKLAEAEEKAEYSKSVIVDKDKEIQKEKIIEEYLNDVANIKSNGEEFDYQVISRKDNDELNLDDKSNNLNKAKPKKISKSFVMLLNSIAESKGFKRDGLIDELREKDIEYLKDNFVSFGEEFIRDGGENFVKRTSSGLLIDIAKENKNLKLKYVELDNLKLVNTARTHEDGDKYIGDFIDIIKSSIDEKADPEKETYMLKMSGNVAILMYDKENEAIIDDIKEKASSYSNDEIGISMDVYMHDMNIEELTAKKLESEYLKAGDAVKIEKDEHNFGVQKIIAGREGNEIFYKRETFKIDEVLEVINKKFEDSKELLQLAEELEKLEPKECFAYINQISDEGELSDEVRDKIITKISFDLVRDEIENAATLDKELRNSREYEAEEDNSLEN